MAARTASEASAQMSFDAGRASEARGDFKRALAAFKLAHERAPRETAYVEAVARVYEGLGKTAQATEWYLRAAQVQDDVANPVPGKARWFYDLGVERIWLQGLQPNRIGQEEVAASAERIEQLLAYFGPDAMALRKLAQLQGRLGRILEATLLIDEARKAEMRLLRWH